MARSDFSHRADLSGIRCVQQLGMLKLWFRLKEDAALPYAAAVSGSDLERVREKLMMLEVIWQDGAPRYKIRYHGIDFERMYNRNCVGRYIDEAMSPAVRESGLRAYRSVVDDCKPAFNITPVRSANGKMLNYERLLLPFTNSGQGVDHIFTVITLFAEDNCSPFDIFRNAVPAAP